MNDLREGLHPVASAISGTIGAGASSPSPPPSLPRPRRPPPRLPPLCPTPPCPAPSSSMSMSSTSSTSSTPISLTDYVSLIAYDSKILSKIYINSIAPYALTSYNLLINSRLSTPCAAYSLLCNLLTAYGLLYDILNHYNLLYSLLYAR
ncbi:hypothetical protein Dimus_039780 [Dionaea muscipula]